MPTPSIQTLVTDAQQILNLDSISAVRSVVAVALANANTGTPLNPNLTTQQLWNEFYQVVNKPKSDIESIIANQLMKFLFAPPAPGGVGADGQVIFNDGGVLAGDPQFLWNKTTNLLTVTGSATITGDLTVRTNKLKVDSNGVGIGTASPSSGTLSITSNFLLFTDSQSKFGDNGIINGAASDGNTQIQFFGSKSLFFNEGVSTRMTLNSTGLGVGVASPSYNIHARGTTDGRIQIEGASGYGMVFIQASSGNSAQLQLNSNGGSGRRYVVSSNSSGQFLIGDETAVQTRLLIDSTGNVGVGVTPSYRIHAAVASGSNQNIARFQVTGASNGLTITWNNTTSKMIVNFSNLPTSSAGLASGDLWIDTTAGNTLKVA